MKRPVLLIAIGLAPYAVFASVDNSLVAYEESRGGGKLPGFSIVTGFAMALWFAVPTFKKGAPLSDVAFSAYIGFFIGALVGMPVACAFGWPVK